MINWQNRQHKIIIIGSAAILLIAIIVLLFFWLNKKSDNTFNQNNQTGQVNQVKTYPVSAELASWREKETTRLAKATHDTALYQEIKNTKDASRCQEMQGLNGNELCLLDLSSELNDKAICEKITNQEFLTACQENFKN